MFKSINLIILLFISVASNSLIAQLSTTTVSSEWELGVSASRTHLKFDASASSGSSSKNYSEIQNTFGVYLSQTKNTQLHIGTGLGFSNLSYQFHPQKNLWQLDQLVQFSDQPDKSKTPYVLDKVGFNNKYLNLHLFAKFRFQKDSRKTFQPAFALNLDNFFLTSSNSNYHFKGGNGSAGSFAGDLFGSILVSALAGEYVWIGNTASDIQWESPSSSQEKEIRSYYDGRNAKHLVAISPSFCFDFQFTHINFGFEPYLSLYTKTIHQDLSKPVGLGFRSYLSFRF